MSQWAELIRKYFDSFVDQSDTTANVVKWFYVAVSISFSWWMRRTRPVITATPISRKLRLSPKLDRTMVNAIHYFAQAVEPELGEYLVTSPFSVDDVASGWEEKKPSATTAVSVKIISTSTASSGSIILAVWRNHSNAQLSTLDLTFTCPVPLLLALTMRFKLVFKRCITCSLTITPTPALTLTN